MPNRSLAKLKALPKNESLQWQTTTKVIGTIKKITNAGEKFMYMFGRKSATHVNEVNLTWVSSI